MSSLEPNDVNLQIVRDSALSGNLQCKRQSSKGTSAKIFRTSFFTTMVKSQKEIEHQNMIA